MKNKSRSDRVLGMDADITRRDFLNGVGIAVGSTLLTKEASAIPGAQDLPGYYPPSLQGMRGSHPGSFEVGHMARDGAQWNGEDTGESYDLVVVGGGISGLAAAYYYRELAGKNARILILENHDDFGGHAKRNEFVIDNQTIIGYGGTMLIEAPSGYPARAKKLIRELGIETDRFYSYFDRKLYNSLGLDNGTFFDKETFGADYLAVGNLGKKSVLENSPLTGKAKRDLIRLFDDDDHYLQDIPQNKREELLHKIDYLTYLRDYADMDKQLLDMLLPMPRNVWAVNSDAYPAFYAWYGGYPGFGDLTLGEKYEDEEESVSDEPQIFHFPDGNAAIARLLVRKLIPAATTGNSMEDIVTARFDYSKLDDPRSLTRLRLNSTVVRAQHLDDDLKNPVKITYIREGKAQVVEAGRVIMACYNALVPHICPELPAAQQSALKNCIRAPLVYTNVLIKNWTSFVNLGIDHVRCPGFFHHDVRLDFPISMGSYKFSQSPDEPIVLHLTRIPGEPGNPSALGQFNAGKRDLLSTSFETFERNIRVELNRILGDGGFDAARDIAGITVNRWPHGYAYAHDPATDQIAFEPSLWPERMRYWEHGSRPFGNINIAGTDAASNAMTEAAIEEAYRAVHELS